MARLHPLLRRFLPGKRRCRRSPRSRRRRRRYPLPPLHLHLRFARRRRHRRRRSPCPRRSGAPYHWTRCYSSLQRWFPRHPIRFGSRRYPIRSGSRRYPIRTGSRRWSSAQTWLNSRCQTSSRSPRPPGQALSHHLSHIQPRRRAPSRAPRLERWKRRSRDLGSCARNPPKKGASSPQRPSNTRYFGW
jgi:hypothetical protein